MPVYLIHFDRKLSKHAQHYIGYVCSISNLSRRLEHHRTGNGARILNECNERAINYEIVRVWESATKSFERELKNTKNSPKLCPICNPEHWKDNKKGESKNGNE